MMAFLMIFRRFPTTFRRFPKIVLKTWQTLLNIFGEFPKISEDVQRFLKPCEEDPKMFWWYTNEFKYNLRDKLDISEIVDIFTCEDVVSFLSICYHSVYHWLLYNKEYYAEVRRYEFHVQVAKTISHVWGWGTSEILFLPLERKIPIFELTCNVLFTI